MNDVQAKRLGYDVGLVVFDVCYVVHVFPILYKPPVLFLIVNSLSQVPLLDTQIISVLIGSGRRPTQGMNSNETPERQSLRHKPSKP